MAMHVCAGATTCAYADDLNYACTYIIYTLMHGDQCVDMEKLSYSISKVIESLEKSLGYNVEKVCVNSFVGKPQSSYIRVGMNLKGSKISEQEIQSYVSESRTYILDQQIE